MAKNEIKGKATMEELYDDQADTFAARAPGLLWWTTVGIPAYNRNLHQFYRSDTQVLDLGTASARVPQYLITKGIPAENITGVEISSSQVKIARERVPGATFIHGDITNVDLPSEHFNLVTSNMVFEFLNDEDLDRALRNAQKTLKHGGTLFFITTHPDKMKTDSGLDESGCFEATFPWGEKGPNYYRPLSSFTRALERAGFEIDNLEELGIPPEAEEKDPKEYARYSKYKHIRLVMKAHKSSK